MPLTLFIDGLILVLLIVMIFFAVRLSLALKRFRDGRAEMEKMVGELTQHIKKAEKSVNELHLAADESGSRIQHDMNKANAMFDELEIIVQSGDSLANRLEDLAIRNRKIIEGGEGDIADLARKTMGNDVKDYEDRLADLVEDTKKAKPSAKPAKSVFSIRDPELERGEERTEGFRIDDDNDMLSDAERDLYETMRMRQQVKQSKGRKS